MKEKSNRDLYIIVATHKKYRIAKDKIYLPIQVGKTGKPDLGYIGDNTGDNISEKNPHFCELTAIYWAWKNLRSDYIGLCHYRRYFTYGDIVVRLRQCLKIKDIYSLILSGSKAKRLMNKYDVVLPKKEKFPNMSVWEHFSEFHNIKDLKKTKEIIQRLYPDYMTAFNKVMSDNELYLYNMFIMKKELFNEYANWLFNILNELESSIDLTEYSTYQARIFGFISERLFNVWLSNHQLKIKELRVVNLES